MTTETTRLEAWARTIFGDPIRHPLSVVTAAGDALAALDQCSKAPEEIAKLQAELAAAHAEREAACERMVQERMAAASHDVELALLERLRKVLREEQAKAKGGAELGLDRACAVVREMRREKGR